MEKKYNINVLQDRELFHNLDGFHDVMVQAVFHLSSLISTDFVGGFAKLNYKNYKEVASHKSVNDKLSFKNIYISSNIESEFDPDLGLFYSEDKKQLLKFFNFKGKSDIGIKPFKNALILPLFGQKRVFATIVLINVSKQSFENRERLYSYLNYFSIQISHYASYHLRKEVLKCLEKINAISVEIPSDEFNKNEYLNSICKLVGQNKILNYSAIVIRMFSDKGNTSSYGKGGFNIDWNGYKEVFDVEGTFFLEVVESKRRRHRSELKPIDLKRIHNSNWVISQGLTGFACEPIIHGEECIGAISVFTKFKYKFYDFDFMFLTNIASTIGLTLKGATEYRSIKNKMVEQSVDNMKQLDQILDLKEFAHRYKNDIISFSILLKVIYEHSRGQQTVRIEKLKTRFLDRQKELESYIRASKGALGTREYVDLSSLVTDLIEQYEQVIADNNIKLKLSFADIPLLKINLVRFRAVLDNIIQNSIKALYENRRKSKVLQISIYEEADGAEKDITILIMDNGIGIDQADIEDRIFLEGFSKFDGEGTGTGLYFARNVIEDMSGSIFATSSKGETSFFITIPLQIYI